MDRQWGEGLMGPTLYAYWASHREILKFIKVCEDGRIERERVGNGGIFRHRRK
jgi:hypothetical protein